MYVVAFGAAACFSVYSSKKDAHFKGGMIGVEKYMCIFIGRGEH